MSAATVPARVSDLHKSAFWIYGVTAMVMREPVAIVIRHAAAAGVTDPQVCAELLRAVVVLGLMSRLFLASGLYFDQVYLRPDSAARFPRRSYPLDFITGLLHFLLAMGASTVIAGPPAAFVVMVAAYFLFEPVLWGIAAALGHSSAGMRVRSAVTAVAACAGYAAAHAFLPLSAGYVLLLVMGGWDMMKLIGAYDEPALSAAPGT